VTVTVEVPVFPSIVAVITAVPVFTPVTWPFAATVATDVLFEDHVVVARPVRLLLFTSSGVPVSVTLLPFFTDAGAGLTATVLTGFGETVTVDVPLFVSLVAVMTALS